jgi:hypothetical protein
MVIWALPFFRFFALRRRAEETSRASLLVRQAPPYAAPPEGQEKNDLKRMFDIFICIIMPVLS